MSCEKKTSFYVVYCKCISSISFLSYELQTTFLQHFRPSSTMIHIDFKQSVKSNVKMPFEVQKLLDLLKNFRSSHI